MRLMVRANTLVFAGGLMFATPIGCSEDKGSNIDIGGQPGIGGVVSSGGTGGIGTGGAGNVGVSGGGSGGVSGDGPGGVSGNAVDASSSGGAIAVVDTGVGGAGAGGSTGGTVDSGTGGGDADVTSDADGSVVIPADAGDSGPTVDSSMPGTVPIDPPVPDDCITDVSPGDHTFECSGMSFQVMVDEKCTRFACGLIFDVHGATMSGGIMRRMTELHSLAPSQGFLTVHPSANGIYWDWPTDPPKLVDFMNRMIAAFHVDENRIHVTGFSMGSAMTFWFLCNHTEALASTAPATGASAEQVTVVETGENCIDSLDADWQPRIPILFACGTEDILDGSARTEEIVTRLSLTGGDVIDSGNGYTRERYEGADGMVFDFVEHDGGHCVPGGVSCGSSGFHFGEVVLQWFIDHPKQ